MPRTPAGRLPRTAVSLVVLAGIVVVAFTMRAPIIAVAPAIGDIQNDLGIDSATAGLLTTIPVICFGLGTPFVLAITHRSGINNAVFIGLFVTLAGILLRSAGGLAAALIGTLVLGFGITIGNVVVPVIIGRDFADRTTQVTGFYTAALNVGAMAATTFGSPLSGWAGWRWALVLWGLVVVLAALLWKRAVPFTKQRLAPEKNKLRSPSPQGAGRCPQAKPVGTAVVVPGSEVPAPLPALKPLWRRPLVIGMILAFTGQSFGYYGVTAWLPSLLADEQGLSHSAAGASSSFFQGAALVAAFGLPVLMARGLPTRAAMLLVCSAWISLPLGLAFAPSLWVLWCCLGGVAQGGGFTVIFSVVVTRAANTDDARRMSAAVQGIGYTLGATGPIIVGAVHAATGTWTAPMLVIAFMIVLMAVGGSTAIGSRPVRPVRTPGAPGTSGDV